jgi:hypothetical protein
MVVLPILQSPEGYKLISAEEARREGYYHLAKWLEQVQIQWEKRRGEKADRMNVLQRINYRNDLINQKSTHYKVLYPRSASYLCACTIEQETIIKIVNKQILKLQYFISDFTCYYISTNSKNEANYILSILNSDLINTLIKPMQAKGDFGPRDIAKKVLEFPIPRFDEMKKDHLELADIGELCSNKVREIIKRGIKYRSIGHNRRLIRDNIKSELREIDTIVKKILPI